MHRLKRLFLALLASLPSWLVISGCDPWLAPSSASASSVPAGPPTSLSLRVGFYVPVLGTWLVDGFSDSLREELAKYDVRVVQAPESSTTAVITLGDWSDYLGPGRSIGVALVGEGGVTPTGRVWLPDLSMNTLSVAAEQVAVIIVRMLRAPPGSLVDPPGAKMSENPE